MIVECRSTVEIIDCVVFEAASLWAIPFLLTNSESQCTYLMSQNGSGVNPGLAASYAKFGRKF